METHTYPDGDHDGRSPPPVDLTRASYLAWVTMQHRTAEAAIANRLDAIDRARAWGATWEEIGAAMGMSRQVAHKRFGRAVHDWHTDHDGDGHDP